jgi:two-component system KDP operon response regulator KdpE
MDGMDGMDSMDSIVPPIPEARILVVDDEPHVRSALTRALSLRGYRADEASSGFHALGMLERVPYDLMVLDMRMPGMDGVEVMQRARRVRPDLAIIVLTGHATQESAIAAVKAAAADYLLKPTSSKEMVSAVSETLAERAQTLRRQHLMEVMGQALESLREMDSPDPPESGPPEAPAQEDEKAKVLGRLLKAGAVTLDRQMRQVAIAETEATRTVDLTESEVALLAHMMSHPDESLSAQKLAQDALGYETSERESRNIVRPHIYRLRQKIEKDPQEPQLIRTVRGRGYMFVP